jgi:hypothetical protein
VECMVGFMGEVVMNEGSQCGSGVTQPEDDALCIGLRKAR